ncbi:ABC transporter permease [Paenibacillus allorhizosphaerae]|uniref:ABC transporter permease n=1 Tax=Paenibacillus allorhizosphaerae TaxID=2849866 RepID=A0ABN7TJ36_9BACL|nr:ABC-2 family transporter protein [Paenibacillus allorhizosphaerae]CAG7635874.1 hypothetical protein PAECIP111802_02190 [Paenibacillus allorhizosphaerae]
MKLYLAFMTNEFQSNLAYKTDVFLKMFGRVMGLFVQIALWTALYHSTDSATTGMGQISLNDMINYVVISTCISVFVNNDTIFRIGDKIRSGDIGLQLMKPISLQTCMLFQAMGTSASRIFFELTPLVVIAAIFYPLHIPPVHLLLLFAVALINGFVINFLLAYILGMVGFWYLNIYHLSRLLSDVIKVFSGVWIPLWFFPQILTHVSAFLPFRLIYFSPISIYLGKTEWSGALLLIVQQFMWIGILLLVSELVWRRGISKLVIQGG